MLEYISKMKNRLFKKIYYDQTDIKLVTPMEYLDIYPVNQTVQPSMSSWGDKGYHDVWLNAGNDWIYRHLIKAAQRMTEMANQYPNADGLLKRALNQLARELLLMQSSDWAFLMTTGTAKEYSTKRTKDHIKRFNGKYYLSYSTGDTHFLCYAIGDNPYGPFTYQGVILTPVVGWTTHHAIVEYKGKWYLFHHDCVPSGGKTWLRSLKVVELEYDAEGKIITIDGGGE